MGAASNYALHFRGYAVDSHERTHDALGVRLT